MARSIKNWQVLDEETLTEHRYIAFDITTKQKHKKHSRNSPTGTDWNKFLTTLNNQIERQGENTIDKAIDVIQKSYRAGKRPDRANNKTPYWWTTEIEEKRKEYLACEKSYDEDDEKTKRTTKPGTGPSARGTQNQKTRIGETY